MPIMAPQNWKLSLARPKGRLALCEFRQPAFHYTQQLSVIRTMRKGHSPSFQRPHYLLDSSRDAVLSSANRTLVK